MVKIRGLVVLAVALATIAALPSQATQRTELHRRADSHSSNGAHGSIHDPNNPGGAPHFGKRSDVWPARALDQDTRPDGSDHVVPGSDHGLPGKKLSGQEPGGTFGSGGEMPIGSRDELERFVLDFADKEVLHYAKTHGHCDGGDSETCQSHTCLLGSPSCSAFSKEDQRALARELGQLMLKLSSTGKCTPTRFNRAFCNRLGYCSIYDASGKLTADCEPIQSDEFAKLVPLLAPQKDGSFEFVKSGPSGSSSEAGSSGTVSEGQRYTIDDSPAKATASTEVKPERLERDLTKRSLASLDAALAKRQAPTNTASTAKADEDASSDDAKLMEQAREAIVLEAVQLAQTELAELAKTTGACKSADTSNCHEGQCQLGTRGCRAWTQDELAEIEQMWSLILTTVLSAGKCDPTDKAICDSTGYCDRTSHWHNGKPNPRCTALTNDQAATLFESLVQQPPTPTDKSDADEEAVSKSSSGSEAEKKVKRDLQVAALHASTIPVKSNRASTTQADEVETRDEVTEDEVDQFIKVCARLVKHPDELKYITDQAGITDPQVIRRVRQAFEQYSLNRSLARQALEHAKQHAANAAVIPPLSHPTTAKASADDS